MGERYRRHEHRLHGDLSGHGGLLCHTRCRCLVRFGVRFQTSDVVGGFDPHPRSIGAAGFAGADFRQLRDRHTHLVLSHQRQRLDLGRIGRQRRTTGIDYRRIGRDPEIVQRLKQQPLGRF